MQATANRISMSIFLPKDINSHHLNMNAGQPGKKRCDLTREWNGVNLKIEDGIILYNPLLASNAHLFQQKPNFSLR